MRTRWTRLLMIFTTVALAGILAVAVTFAIGSTTFSGRAIGAQVKTALVVASYADTGELAADGGLNDGVGVPAAHEFVQAEVLLSMTSGYKGRGESEVTVADVTLLPGSANEVRAEFVRANAQATCTTISLASEILNLTLAGQPITVSGAPNQSIAVPGVLTLVINEQDAIAGQVNALHLTLATGEEVIVGVARSKVTCG